ncbi:14767_t:CDS:1, partial [Entrophospora sp. SA101]
DKDPSQIRSSINKKKRLIEWWYHKEIELDYYSPALFRELQLM